MDLIARFDEYISSHQLCDKHRDRILVAVSGGRDSVLLLELLVRSGYQVGIAHCNFQLRGKESDLDEELVRKDAEKLGVPIWVKRFETGKYAEKHQISTQMAARDLRYNWFEFLLNEHQFDYIAVAHHATDHVETVLINMLRGTGIRGFCGIPVKRDRIIRPLLFLSHAEVTEAVHHYGLIYRDDQSNFSADYIRNKIRLEVLPVMREINPALEETITQDTNALKDVCVFMDEQIHRLKKLFFVPQKNGFLLNMKVLSGQNPLHFVLYELLKPFGFTASICKDLAVVMQRKEDGTSSGLSFRSAEYVLTLDRVQARLLPLGQEEAQIGAIQEGQITLKSKRFESHGIVIEADLMTKVQWNPKESTQMVAFDADQVTLPLSIRPWQQGDRFRPIGMHGKSKKLSDLFVSLKIPRWQKDSIPVVTDANGIIIWVAPYRMSTDYKITDKTKNVLTLSYFCEDGG